MLSRGEIWFLVILFTLFGGGGVLLLYLSRGGDFKRAMRESNAEAARGRPSAIAGDAMPSAAAPGTGAAEQRYPVTFTATAGEYFRIWIVNLALTIVTLGIYSAWAKVRKKRYFYAHTRIDGDGFEYRGQPIAILKGRFIALALAAALYGANHFYPSVLWIIVLAAVLIAPWLIVRSLAFNAWNTAYRNIRLHFRGGYRECLKVILWNGFLTVITGGLLYPYLKARLLQFAAGYHRYGITRFKVAELKPLFESVYIRAIGLGLLLVIALFAMGAAAGALFGQHVPALVLNVVFPIVAYVGYLFIFSYLRARIANATWNSIAVGPVRFECAMRAREMFVLYLTNILSIIATLGLATPWAVVRTMRYRAGKMTVIATGDVGQFVQGESSRVDAAGEEVGEMFDVGIGL